MPTKAQVQEQLEHLQKEHKQVQKSLDQVRLVLQVTERDLQRAIDFVSDQYDETGSELAERFEQGMKLAIERLKAGLLEQQQPLDWSGSLWQERASE